MQWLLVRHVLSSTWFNKIIFCPLVDYFLGFPCYVIKQKMLIFGHRRSYKPPEGSGVY